MSRRATRSIYETRWVKENLRCRIISQREFLSNGNLSKISTIIVAGDNPFPCYSMTSTYHVVAEWMCENGWEPVSGYRKETRYDVIDDHTGEVINTYCNTVIVK